MEDVKEWVVKEWVVKDYDQLLEDLEDLVGQMQMEKITFEQAKQCVKSLNQYYSQLEEK